MLVKKKTLRSSQDLNLGLLNAGQMFLALVSIFNLAIICTFLHLSSPNCSVMVCVRDHNVS